MRFGLRLQILLLLGGSMLLAFVLLFVAVATYTSVTLRQVRESNARSLGRAIAGHVGEARERRSPDELMSLLAAEVGAEGVEAIGVYDAQGRPLARAGRPELVDRLSGKIDPEKEAILELGAEDGPAVAVVVPDVQGAVVVIVRTDDVAQRAKPLLELVALYTGLFALALLVLTYFALTRLIVRPLDALARSAERVASGARRLEIPHTGFRELETLGKSLRTMTERLLHEEDALRRKVDEVERATARLQTAQENLVRSERLASVGRLAAGLAHEIGNPISALMGLQDLLLAGGLNDEQSRDFVQRMRRETERIHRILRDLLQFARPGSASTGPTAPGSVERALEDTAALVAPQKALENVELVLDVEQDLPFVKLGDSELVQVVLNLVLNAVDACGTGGHVELRARSGPPGVVVEVIDDGPGVAPEVVDRLFEPFVTTKEIGKGTGLGLAVCRGLVEAVGGTIALDTTYTAGAHFVVELPRVEDEEHPASAVTG